LLRGDAATAVAGLKNQPGGVLAIMGSGRLIESLLPHNLIDEFLLMIHPVVLGSGRRLFPDGGPVANLQLVDTMATASGLLIATYQRSDLDSDST
jgi:dihydrofolate reductase